MRVLQEQLDDPDPSDCGRCSACTSPRFGTPSVRRWSRRAGRHLRSKPLEIEIKKMAPDQAGTMRKISATALVEPGWALARFGDGGWWPAVERGLRSGSFDEEVVAGLERPARWRGGLAGVRYTTVPSVRLGGVLVALAERLAERLGIPALALLARTEPRPPQREMANSVQQAANVRGAFRVVETPAGPARGSCSTTDAAPAGRSRWSAASCGPESDAMTAAPCAIA